MNFDDFWNMVRSSGDLQLETRDKKRLFTMHYESRTDAIEITPQKTRGVSSPISRAQFARAWNVAITSVIPFEYDTYRQFEHIASYFGPIMKHFLNDAKIE